MTAFDRGAPDDHPGWPARRHEPLDLLLIEDCPADVRLIELHCAAAEAAGDVRLTAVDTLADATYLLARHDYSCVLVDLGLPDASGAATLEKLRRIDPEVAVVVLTGDDREDTVEQALRLGAQDYLVKGRHDAGLLLRRVRFAVQQRRAQVDSRATGAESFAVATLDAATGLPNRLLFEDRGTHALAQAARMGAGVALLAIAFDAPYMDVRPDGSAADDAQLRRVAAALQAELRVSDTVAALADDRFAALLAPTDADFDALAAARLLAQRLLAGSLRGLRLHIGVACFPDDGDTLVDLLEHAEQAMHRARRDGDGVCRHVAVAGLRPTVASAASAAALAARIEVRWQPWFDARDGRMVGLEALPTCRGVAVGERDAAIATLRPVLRQFHEFRAVGLAIEALGLRCPGALIEHADLPSLLAAELAPLGIEPQGLWLQVAADDLAAASPAALARLRMLRDQGYGLTLDAFLDTDDSLGALTAMPIDAVRLGREAVAMLPLDRNATSLRRSVVALVGAAGALNLRLIACGVDDSGRRDLLSALGVRYLQGDALCPAVDASELPACWADAARAVRESGQ